MILVILQVIADICLVIQLKRTVENKMETNGGKSKEKQKKEAEDRKNAVKRAVVMVILNATFSIVFKSPTAIRPIYELFIYSSHHGTFLYDNNNYVTMSLKFDFKYCGYISFCLFFDEFVKFLYLLSLCLNLLFFYKFDKTFKVCFLRVFKNGVSM